jgi:putative transcriptional regulator
MLRWRVSLVLLIACLLPPLAAAERVQSVSILLVAASSMKDPRFAQTVIVVTRHGRSPPIGVIVNRPTGATVGQLFPKLPDAELSRPLFYGGPVATDQVTFLFRSRHGSDDAIAVSPNSHLGRSGATLRKLLRGEHPHQGLRVIVGYSGWAFGQLEKEIERGDWFVLPMDEKAVFEQPAETLWRDLHRRASITTVSIPHPNPDT